MSLSSYKNIAVLGIGISGLAAIRLISAYKHINQKLYGLDSREVSSWAPLLPDTVIPHHQNELASILHAEDLLVVSPGVDTRGEVFSDLIKNGITIISEIELASWWIESPIIGITGTNGKTTTVSFLSKCFEAAGINCFTGGNIGTPLCEAIINKKFDLYLLELSSFQLERLLTLKIDYPVILNLSESHMERYESIDKYVQAKLNIYRSHNETDHIFCRNKDVQSFKHLFPELPDDHEYLDSSDLIKEFLALYEVEKIKLPGNHNLENLIAAWSVFKSVAGKEKADIFKSILYTFESLDHRLEEIKSTRDFKIINDTKSTNLDSTLAAIKSYTGSIHLILGGKLRDKEFDLGMLDEIIASVNFITPIGEAEELLLKSIPVDKLIRVKEFAEIKTIECTSEVLLFSPGFPSFDQFANYADRGNQFKELFTNA